MDLRRLRVGEWVTALAGVALLVSLFLPWYSDEGLCDSQPPVPCGAEHLTAWQALAVNDVIFAVIALAAIGLVAVTAMQPTAAVPIAYDALLFLVSLVGGTLAVVRVLAPPAVAEGRQAGIWVALVATAGIAVGAAAAMRDERLSGEGPPTDGTGHPAAPVAVEQLPAPPRGAEGGR